MGEGIMTKEMINFKKFEKELADLINIHSIENYCDMPDFLLAQALCGIISVFGNASKKNLDWHGCDSICHPYHQKKNRKSHANQM